MNSKAGVVLVAALFACAAFGFAALQGKKARGKEIAQAAAQSAVGTAKEEGKQHGEELSSSLQEKAQEVTQSES